MSNITDACKISHFYMMPNIIHELGLDPYEFMVYSLLKRIAGEGGYSIYSNTKLAQMAQMSKAKFKEVKTKLASIFPHINCPLIQVFERKTISGDSDTNNIVLVNIWGINDKFYEEKKRIKDEKNQKKEGGVGHNTTQGVGHNMTEGGSQGGPKEYSSQENDLKKEKKERKKESEHSEVRFDAEVETEVQHEAKPAKPASSPFSFSNQDIEGVFKSVKNLCPDRNEFQRVLEYAYSEQFWKSKINKAADFFKHFKSIHDQVKPIIKREQVIMKRKLYALTKQFNGSNGSISFDETHICIVSGAYVTKHSFTAESEYWNKLNLGFNDEN
jgi:hypothetical protein